MQIVKGNSQEPKKIPISDLNVGDIFKFAEPWCRDSEKQIYLVCKSLHGLCSVSLAFDEVVFWNGEGHEKNLAILLNARVEIL